MDGVTSTPESSRLTEQVVLVDRDGLEVGVMGKTEAHREPGHLHRAFSLFIRNSAGEVLLQRRAVAKYHFGGVWANACCSHPRPGEPLVRAVERRTLEELGIECRPEPIGSFVYRAGDPVSGLVEHEFDHVFESLTDTDPSPDPAEVMDWRWVAAEDLATMVDTGDPTLAPWVHLAVEAFPRLVSS